VGPNTNEPVPTAIFHGVRQNCDEHKLHENVNEISRGTRGYVECIEIGNGDLTSIFSSALT